MIHGTESGKSKNMFKLFGNRYVQCQGFVDSSHECAVSSSVPPSSKDGWCSTDPFLKFVRVTQLKIKSVLALRIGPRPVYGVLCLVE